MHARKHTRIHAPECGSARTGGEKEVGYNLWHIYTHICTSYIHAYIHTYIHTYTRIWERTDWLRKEAGYDVSYVWRRIMLETIGLLLEIVALSVSALRKTDEEADGVIHVVGDAEILAKTVKSGWLSLRYCLCIHVYVYVCMYVCMYRT
jgi:hypothetical protein